MEEQSGTGRREFVQRVGAAAWGAWLTVNLSACRDAAEQARQVSASGGPFVTLTPGAGRAAEAMCETLVPSGDTPGAREAGAAHFIDLVLGSFESGGLPLVQGGLERLDARAGTARSGATFADLDPTERIRVLEEVENDDAAFFGTMRYLTVCGTFCHPDAGGNRDRAGWTLLGMDVQNAYQPPFGHYDRGHHGGEAAS